MDGDRRVRRHAIAGLVMLAGVVVAPRGAAAQPRVTFTRDVAPIVFEHCATCHRPGDIAPFSLLTYDDVRPRARGDRRGAPRAA